MKTGTVRFELTTFFRSTYFQDKRHKPDSAKYPFPTCLTIPINLIAYVYLLLIE